MLDLEETIRNLNQLKQKLENLGVSLWHTKIRKRISRIRKRN